MGNPKKTKQTITVRLNHSIPLTPVEIKRLRQERKETVEFFKKMRTKK